MLSRDFIRGAGVALVVSAIVAGGVAARADRRARRAAAIDAAAVAPELRDLRDDVDAAARINARSTDRATRHKVARALDRARADLDRLADGLALHDAARSRGAAMADADLRDFLAAIDAAAMADDKRGLVAQAARDAWFTSAQVAAIVDRIAMGDDKVEVAVTLHPRVVDPESFYKVFGKLAHTSDRDELRRRIDAAQR